MENIKDNQLISEIKKRLNDYKKSLVAIKKLNKKLELLNARLEESERMKSHFLSNIRNEINNPLSSIIGMAEILMGVSNGTIDPEMVLSSSRIIHKEALELDFQLKNIFVAAEIEAGDCGLNISRVDIKRVIKSVVDIYKISAGEKSINFKFNCKIEDDTLFNTDSEKLFHILLNLLDNAVKYTPDCGKIEVDCSVVGNKLLINIKDSGKGIAQKDVKRVFDRFFQSEKGVRKSFKGHGLGLSIVKYLSELIGGYITYEKMKNNGSLFKLSLIEHEHGVIVDTFSEDGNEFFFDEDNDEDKDFEVF